MICTWFERPTQVKFWDYENEQWQAGIAFRDEVICLCCGGVLNLKDFDEDMRSGEYNMPPNGKNPLEVLEWINLVEECLGDMFDEE